MKTTEEKAKRYDEALEKARSFYKRWDGISASDSNLVIAEVKEIFPELKEDSEDEKSKKWILEYLYDGLRRSDEQFKGQFKAAIAWLEKKGENKNDCPQKYRDSSHPNGCIVLEDFNGGEGFYKLHLDYLNEKQVKEVEEMIRVWNKELKAPNENIKDCIGMCLTDIDEQRFKDFNTNLRDCLAWLEKQGEIDKASYEIAEKEKYDFVSGKFIECRKSFNEFKEDNSYWFEYVGNDTYIGRSDNILNKTFHITPRQLYRLFTQQHCPKENNVNEETNAPTAYGKYVDECLNEAVKHFYSEGEDKYSIADLFYAGVRCGQSWFGKQGEQKPVIEMKSPEESLGISSEEYNKIVDACLYSDKVEPKFHEGDWIIHYGTENIYQVVAVIDNQYQLKYGDNYTVQNCADVDRCARLWDIAKDAKYGDVLSNGTTIFIFKDLLSDGSVMSYCDYDADSGESDVFCPLSVNLVCSKITPATKEQRDLLLTKMREAGYEFDFEKKELKKIEQKPAEWKPTDEQMDALVYIIKHYTPAITDALGWESLRTVELMISQLRKL